MKKSIVCALLGASLALVTLGGNIGCGGGGEKSAPEKPVTPFTEEEKCQCLSVNLILANCLINTLLVNDKIIKKEVNYFDLSKVPGFTGTVSCTLLDTTSPYRVRFDYKDCGIKYKEHGSIVMNGQVNVEYVKTEKNPSLKINSDLVTIVSDHPGFSAILYGLVDLNSKLIIENGTQKIIQYGEIVLGGDPDNQSYRVKIDEKSPIIYEIDPSKSAVTVPSYELQWQANGKNVTVKFPPSYRTGHVNQATTANLFN